MSLPYQNKYTKNEKVTDETATRKQENNQVEGFKPFDTVSFPTGMSNTKFDGFQASIDNGSLITGSTILGSTDNATKGNSFPIFSNVCHNKNIKIEKETTSISKQRRYFKYDPYIIQQILVNALNAGNVTPEKIRKYNEFIVKRNSIPDIFRLLGTKDREIYCSNFINDNIKSVISPLNGLWLRISKIIKREDCRVSGKESKDLYRMSKNSIGWNYNEKQKATVEFSHGFYVQLFSEKNDTYPLDMGMTNAGNVSRKNHYWTKPFMQKNLSFGCEKSYSRLANAAFFTLSRNNKKGTWVSKSTNTAYPVIIEDLSNTSVSSSSTQ